MRIAIVGTGISGLSAAYLLNRKHDIHVYESATCIGGHTATKDIQWEGHNYSIDTGFIVFNDWTYPHFEKLLEQLGVASKPTTMGFSVTNENSGLEYSGTNIDTLFSQRRNIFSSRHWRMIKDILRFNKQSIIDVESARLPASLTLGEYLYSNRYSTGFMEDYLIPMGAAIWSASHKAMYDFPLQFFVDFFKNHGLLSVNNRPQWRVVAGGSNRYLEPLIQGFRDRISLNSPVEKISRTDQQVSILTAAGNEQYFDRVVIATHSDQALAMLADPTDDEVAVLGKINYQMNDVVLHTDRSMLPSCRKAWSSWNYRITGEQQMLPVLTYNMNILQGIDSPTTFCVTLNDTNNIDVDKIIGRYQYAHPVFTLDSIQAQRQWPLINGVHNTWYCGAYWGNGFHEDGVSSALRVAQQFGESL